MVKLELKASAVAPVDDIVWSDTHKKILSRIGGNHYVAFVSDHPAPFYKESK